MAPAFLERVASASDRNFRRAVLMLESAKTRECVVAMVAFVCYYGLCRACNPDSAVLTTDWERFVASIADDMVTEQTPQRCAECVRPVPAQSFA